MKKATLAFALLLALQAPAQTPAQVVQQIKALVSQLEQMLTPQPQAANVATADQLTAALAQGGSIKAAAGTYVGNFVISKPTTLVGAGQGVTIIKPLDPLMPPLSGTADDVTVQDLTVKNGAPDRDTLIFGTIGATSAAALPHRVKLQRITVSADAGGHRGVLLNGTDMTLDSSTVVGFYEKGRDSQAICIINGPGPYAITNNVLEASGENILIGGADPGIVGVNPSDVTVSGNTIRKPASYHTLGTVKDLLELKTGVRVAITNNTFDGNWADGQSGNAIVLTVRNQDGKCTWCQVDDVTFRGNVVTNAVDGFGVNIQTSDNINPSQTTNKITIDHNLFAQSPKGVQVLGALPIGLIITNNTFPSIAGQFLSFSNSTGILTPLTFSRNVTKSGDYGVTGVGTGAGTPSLTPNVQLVEWNGNVIEKSAARSIPYPTGTGNVLVAPGGLAALLNPMTYKLLSGTAGY